MKTQGKFPRIAYYSNRLHMINALVFVIIIYCFSALAAYYSYSLERNKVLETNHEATKAIGDYFDGKLDKFWSVFAPAFQKQEYYEAISEFLSAKDGKELSDPLLRKNLVELFDWTALQDPDIKWILLHRGNDALGYVFNPVGKNLTQTPPDFPYLERLKKKNTVRSIYGFSSMTMNQKTIGVYGIAGNAYIQVGTETPSSLLVGYDIQPMAELYKRYSFAIPTQILIMTLDGEVIYDSSGKYAYGDYSYLPQRTAQGPIPDKNGRQDYVETMVKPTRNYMVACIVRQGDLAAASGKNTWAILGISTAFALLSAALYILAGHLVSRRVKVISEGLRQIGRHNLSYRIPLAKSADEFGLIARDINTMSEEMENNIQKLYVYQLKQKTAELGEMQSKFNPHFLYNTLEVIRNQLQANGDDSTAQMVLLLAGIFRNFIKSKPFVTIHEEIAFCSTYLELFKMRYPDRIHIVFDLETELLGYGIICKLLQPIIENYFVHGFDSSRTDNSITISGHLDGDRVVIAVEDNGLGISGERLEQIHQNLAAESRLDCTDYGLKSVHDRILIFYGGDCGVDVQSRPGAGTVVGVRIRKMTCEQHQEHMENGL